MTCTPRWLVVYTVALVACSPPERSPQPAQEPVVDSVTVVPTVVENDSGLVFSPDSSMVAFVRASSDRFVEQDTHSAPAKELWIARRDGSQSRRLLEVRESPDMRQILTRFDDLVFSNDGKRLFFLSPAWATSSALHVVDIQGANERYIAPANSLQLLRTGTYAGCLVVSQHRYFVGGGSYDHHWLIAENGDEIGLVAFDDEEHLKRQVNELLSYAADAGPSRSCASREELRRRSTR